MSKSVCSNCSEPTVIGMTFCWACGSSTSKVRPVATQPSVSAGTQNPSATTPTRAPATSSNPPPPPPPPMTSAQVAAAAQLQQKQQQQQTAEPTGTLEIIVALLAAPFGFLCLIPQMFAFSFAWKRFKAARLLQTPTSATARVRSTIAMVISVASAWLWLAYI
jgi:hypothetical protein